MTRVVFMVLALLGLVVRGFAQPYTDLTNIPDTAACRRGVEIVELINACEPTALEAYVREHFAPEFRDRFPLRDHLDFALQTHRATGRLEVHAARAYDPPRPAHHAVIICRNTMAESWGAIVVQVEETEPYRVTGVSFNPARPPTGQPPEGPLTLDEACERLGAYIDRMAKAELFSGTAIVAKDGVPVFSRAVGIANRDFAAPVNIDTKFNLGSMNKMMTGVAVMQLVEQGKLSLEDPISKFLSEDWLPRVDKSRVKVVHLLTHTSGLGSYFNDEWAQASRARFRSVDDWKPLVAEETLAFEPGTQTAYSNTGMLVAGAVIESASGMSYEEYVRQHITGPAGMKNTGLYELDRVNPNLAVGYEPEFVEGRLEYRNNVFLHVIKGGPAGGGYSTVGDLLKFDQALRSGALLRPESLAELWKARPEIGSPEYGLGFGVSETPLGRVVGHTGGFPGISASLSMFLDSGYTVTVLSNFGGAAVSVDQRAIELLTRVETGRQ